MTNALVKHLTKNNDNSEPVQAHLQAMFEFMYFMLMYFNKIELFHEVNKEPVYNLFLRDALLPFMRKAIAEITHQPAPHFQDIEQNRACRSTCLMTHLLYMLTPAYLKQVDCNVDAWFSEQKQHLRHGVGIDFKKTLRCHKGKSSIISKKTIDTCCQQLDGDKTSAQDERFKYFPSTLELKAFWYSARAAQYFSKWLVLSTPTNVLFSQLEESCLVIFKRHLSIGDFSQVCEEEFTTPFEILESGLSQCNKIISGNTSKSLNLISLTDFNHAFTVMIHQIANNELALAYNTSSELLIKCNHQFVGQIYDTIIKVNIALKIKLGIIKSKDSENALMRVAFGLGSNGFTFERNELDAYSIVANSIFSLPSSRYILSSIQFYGEIVDELEGSISKALTLEEKLILIPAIPRLINEALACIYEHQNDLASMPPELIKKLLSPFMYKNCISYIPNSTLYYCLAEINTLRSYWPAWFICDTKYIDKFCREPIAIKRKVLLSIDYTESERNIYNNSKVLVALEINHDSERSPLVRVEAPVDIEHDYYYVKTRMDHAIRNARETPSIRHLMDELYQVIGQRFTKV